MDVTTRWTPNTAGERDLVIAELQAIVASYHFRGSKRYPALLKYVVHKTLDGHSDELKERTLGVEVFDRSPDYDTNADPVVRTSAGEVRKRIAQYYFETGANSPLQIDIPLGSYIPEFRPKTEPTERQQAHPTPLPNPYFAPLRLRFRSKRFRSVAAIIVFGALLFGSYEYHRAARGDITHMLWGDLLQSQGPVLVVVGSSHPEVEPIPEPVQTTLIDHERGPYHHISLASAIALSRITGVLQAHGRTYAVKEDSGTSLTDLRSRPVILVGAMNNIWTMRLIDPLRFRFIDGPPTGQIQDMQNLQNTEWNLNFTQPYTSTRNDYAIVARYHDASTDGTVLIVAGLGIYGTEAASELVASPEYLDRLTKMLPAGWENKNLELVLKTNIIRGEPGPPSLVSFATW
jgi:hypothetical protein